MIEVSIATGIPMSEWDDARAIATAVELLTKDRPRSGPNGAQMSG